MSTDTFEIEALDQPTFTQVGHWVAFRSDLSPTARHLYTVLATFVNQGRRANGDTSVWPSLNLLAVTLGLSKGKSVTPYMDELLQARIVEKTTNTIGGMRSRNTYGIRFNPPPGEKTTTNFVELLEPLKALAGDAKAMTKASAETRELIKERRARESAKRTGRPVVPDRGLRRPESGPTYPRIGDRNKTQGELDAGLNTRTSSSSAGAPAEPPQGEAPEKKTKRDSPEQIVKNRLGCTPEEAAKVVTYVNQQGDGNGNRIRSLAWWVGQRDIHTLRQDLAMVRVPQAPTGASYSQDPGAYLRSINKGGHQPYKNPVDQSVYDEPLLSPARPVSGAHGAIISPEQLAAMNEMTNEERVNMLFGAPDSPRPPHDPRYARGTGSWVDPNAVYTDDPKVVFGTGEDFTSDF